MFPISAQINSVAGADMNAKFNYPFTHGFCIAHIAGLKLTQSACNTCLGNFVPERRQPFFNRTAPVRILEVDDLDHAVSVA